jgi:hypothetical protein
MTSTRELQIPEERDWGRLQKVERSPMPMDWEKQPTKSNLYA